MVRKRTEPNIATYLHNKGARMGLPIGGTFELTARCNFHCPMCYVHMSEEQVKAAGRELTAAEWIEIARQAKERGLIFVLLTGGEPFVRKDFFEIYKAMKEMGLLISINSNGSMLEGEILRRLLEDPPFRINISLYGGCNETYQNMCGQPVFDKVVNNIRALREAGVEVMLKLSITPYNYQDIEKIYQISKDLGVQIKATTYMYPSIRVNGEQYGCGNRLSPKEAAEYSVKWDLLRFSKEEFNLRAASMEKLIAVDEKECLADLDEGVRCRAGSTNFWMTWDGRMLPCGMMPKPFAYPLEIGFDKAWEQVKKQTREIRISPACSSCSKKEVCFACAAVCLTETGAFDEVPKYVCHQIDETIKATIKACCEGERNETEKGID